LRPASWQLPRQEALKRSRGLRDLRNRAGGFQLQGLLQGRGIPACQEDWSAPGWGSASAEESAGWFGCSCQTTALLRLSDRARPLPVGDTAGPFAHILPLPLQPAAPGARDGPIELTDQKHCATATDPPPVWPAMRQAPKGQRQPQTGWLGARHRLQPEPATSRPGSPSKKIDLAASCAGPTEASRSARDL